MAIRTGIYVIRNTINGKVYVGSAINIRHRWQNHEKKLSSGRHPSLHLQAAWNCYGESAFVFEVLEDCGRDVLLDREQHHIDSMQATDSEHGYNLRKIASSNLGLRMSDATRAKMSKASRRHSPTEEHKRRLTEVHTGKVLSEETRQKIRIKRASQVFSDATRAKMSEAMSGENNPMYGKPGTRLGVRMSDETKALVGAAHKGKIVSAETRAKQSAAAKNRRKKQIA